MTNNSNNSINSRVRRDSDRSVCSGVIAAAAAATAAAADDDDDDGFDSLLSVIGFGRWQVPSVLMVLLVAALYPIQMVGVSLIAPPVPFRCHTTKTTTTTTTTTTTSNVSLYLSEEDVRPYTTNTTQYYDEVCVGDGLDKEGPLLLLPSPSPSSPPPQLHHTNMPSCPIIEYNTDIFSSSVVSDFHLVCERFNLQALYQITFTVGAMVGSMIGGQIGDRWGRRKAVQVGGLLYLGGVVAIALVPVYEVVLLMRAVVGFANTSSLVTGWNMVVESTPATARTLVGMLMGLPYSLFIGVFAGVAYAVTSWQNVMLLCSTPVLILVPLSFVLDESPRWLLQHGHTKQAHSIIERAMEKHKVTYNGDLYSAVEKIAKRNMEGSHHPHHHHAGSGGGEGGGCVSERWSRGVREAGHYFRSPGMRVILIVAPIIWFFQNFTYVGLAINANNFSSDNPFLYVALTGVMDGAAILLSTPITPFLGRRTMVGGELFIGGVLILVELAIPNDYSWFKWTIVMIGFLLVAGAFQVNFVYAPELFPTRIRATGFALVNTVGNLGLMCAPLVTTNLAKMSRWAPGLVFGCSGVLISLLVLLLPETRKRPLPETIRDVDERWRAGRRGGKGAGGVEGGVENMAYKYDGEKVDDVCGVGGKEETKETVMNGVSE